eukprot:6256025-Amphidinium_carterae.1
MCGLNYPYATDDEPAPLITAKASWRGYCTRLRATAAAREAWQQLEAVKHDLGRQPYDLSLSIGLKFWWICSLGSLVAEPFHSQLHMLEESGKVVSVQLGTAALVGQKLLALRGNIPCWRYCSHKAVDLLVHRKYILLHGTYEATAAPKASMSTHGLMTKDDLDSRLAEARNGGM